MLLWYYMFRNTMEDAFPVAVCLELESNKKVIIIKIKLKLIKLNLKIN
jgi:hypothetical protein